MKLSAEIITTISSERHANLQGREEEEVSVPRSARLCTGCMTECSNEQIGIDCVFVAGKDVVVAAPSTFTICIVALAHTHIFV